MEEPVKAVQDGDKVAIPFHHALVRFRRQDEFHLPHRHARLGQLCEGLPHLPAHLGILCLDVRCLLLEQLVAIGRPRRLRGGRKRGGRQIEVMREFGQPYSPLRMEIDLEVKPAVLVDRRQVAQTILNQVHPPGHEAQRLGNGLLVRNRQGLRQPVGQSIWELVVVVEDIKQRADIPIQQVVIGIGQHRGIFQQHRL